MYRLLFCIVISTIFLSMVAGCTLGGPEGTAEKYAMALCAGDIDTAERCLSMKMRTKARESTYHGIGFKAGLKNVLGLEGSANRVEDYSYFEVTASSGGQATVVWKVDLGTEVETVVGLTSPPAGKPKPITNEMKIMTFHLEKGAGGWKIVDIIDAFSGYTLQGM